MAEAMQITIQSNELSKEELRALIQSIRDCEQKCFPDKEIFIWIEVPELTREEANDILASIKPPYKYGPAELPEFHEYAQCKYPDALDEDLITMIEDLIQRGQGDKDHQ